MSALQALADEVQAECECEQLEEEMAAREARRRQRQEQVNSRREQLQHQEQVCVNVSNHISRAVEQMYVVEANRKANQVELHHLAVFSQY